VVLDIQALDTTEYRAQPHTCKIDEKKYVRMSIGAGGVRRLDRSPNRYSPTKGTAMRFMIIIKSNADSEAGKPPSTELLSAMMKYNEELVRAGVMLAGEGLHPSSKGARVKFSGAKRSVVDGPFTETKELIAGFWIIQVKSKEEAIEWVKRIPNPTGDDGEVEIRQVVEASDFETATPEILAKEAELRAGATKNRT
jgi:hypothetical protein